MVLLVTKNYTSLIYQNTQIRDSNNLETTWTLNTVHYLVFGKVSRHSDDSKNFNNTQHLIYCSRLLLHIDYLTCLNIVKLSFSVCALKMQGMRLW